MPLVMIKSDPKAREKPCLRCGYSLRRLGDSTHCPECGLSVWLSLNQNDVLEMSSPQWLRRCALALRLIAASQILLAVATFFYVGRRYFWEIEFTLVGLTAGAYLIAFAAGLVILTLPEGRYPDKLAGYRLGSRIVAGLVTLLGGMILIRAPSGVRLARGVVRQLDLWSFWFGIAMLLLGITMAVYVGRLARRIPHKTLMRTCRFGMFVLIAVAVVSLPGLWYSIVYEFRRVLRYFPFLYAAAIAAFSIWVSILLIRQAKTAEKNWATETALTR